MKITTCPVCGSRENRVLFSDRNRRDGLDCEGTYVRCRKCGLVYLGVRPDWQTICGYYGSTNADVTANTGRLDIEAYRRQLEKKLPVWTKRPHLLRRDPHSWPFEKPAAGRNRMLDIGCGCGYRLFEFSVRGYETWGIDVSADAIDVCRKILPKGRFFCGEPETLSLPENYFDYIRLDNVLEHVPDPVKTLGRCFSLLRNQGRIFVYVPHAHGLGLKIFRQDSVVSWIPFHLQLFTRESLKDALSTAGFSRNRVCGHNQSGWLALSLAQRRSRGRRKAALNAGHCAKYLCRALGFAAGKFGLSEELAAAGIKNA